MVARPRDAVKFKVAKRRKPVKDELTAQEILDLNHPLHPTFMKFLDGKEVTKRQARKFLQEYPQFRSAVA